MDDQLVSLLICTKLMQRAAIGDFGDHSDLHNQVNGGDSIQMAACYLRRGDSDQWRKKKRKYAELEGDTNNEMTADLTRASVDVPYLEQPHVSGEHHMVSITRKLIMAPK